MYILHPRSVLCFPFSYGVLLVKFTPMFQGCSICAGTTVVTILAQQPRRTCLIDLMNLPIAYGKPSNNNSTTNKQKACPYRVVYHRMYILMHHRLYPLMFYLKSTSPFECSFPWTSLLARSPHFMRKGAPWDGRKMIDVCQYNTNW